MTTTYDLDCGDETITLELLDDGTLICHSLGFDIESELIAKEMGFEPHPCFEDMSVDLINAIKNVEIGLVELLLSAGADVNIDDGAALQWASYIGHAEIIKLLLEHGADIHSYDDAALRNSAENGHVDAVKVLLEAGANVHAYKDYALRYATLHYHTDVVEILEDWIKEHG